MNYFYLIRNPERPKVLCAVGLLNFNRFWDFADVWSLDKRKQSPSLFSVSKHREERAIPLEESKEIQKFSPSFHGKRYQLSKGVFWTGEHANQEELSFRGPSCKTFLRKRTKQACRLIGLEVNWLEVIADSLHCCRLGMFLKTLPHVETIWSKWVRIETMPHTNIAIEKSL